LLTTSANLQLENHISRTQNPLREIFFVCVSLPPSVDSATANCCKTLLRPKKEFTHRIPKLLLPLPIGITQLARRFFLLTCTEISNFFEQLALPGLGSAQPPEIRLVTPLEQRISSSASELPCLIKNTLITSENFNSIAATGNYSSNYKLIHSLFVMANNE